MIGTVQAHHRRRQSEHGSAGGAAALGGATGPAACATDANAKPTETCAIDGKTVRASFDADRGVPHTLMGGPHGSRDDLDPEHRWTDLGCAVRVVAERTVLGHGGVENSLP